MTTALVPYPTSSMLEFTSTDFGYVANYTNNFCYPERNENYNFPGWESQAMYPYQPSLNCEFGLFSSAARQNHIMHQQRLANHAKNGNTGTTPNQQSPSKAKPRRRVASVAQRRAANIRERRRMFNLNEGFDVLRKKVPTFAYEKRLSRIETLRLAMTYIAFMTEVLQGGYSRNEERQWANGQGMMASHVGGESIPGP